MIKVWIQVWFLSLEHKKTSLTLLRLILCPISSRIHSIKVPLFLVKGREVRGRGRRERDVCIYVITLIAPWRRFHLERNSFLFLFSIITYTFICLSVVRTLLLSDDHEEVMKENKRQDKSSSWSRWFMTNRNEVDSFFPLVFYGSWREFCVWRTQ